MASSSMPTLLFTAPAVRAHDARRYAETGGMKALPADTYVPLISGPIQDYTRYWLAGQVKESPAKVKAVFADAAWNAVRGGVARG